MRAAWLAVVILCTASRVHADPRTDYLLYCRGCHRVNGEGVPPDVPSLHELGPLAGSAAGREYLVRVPGVSQTPMDNARLAAVLNWVMSEFNSDTLPGDFKPYSTTEVAAARARVLLDPLRARAEILGR